MTTRAPVADPEQLARSLLLRHEADAFPIRVESFVQADGIQLVRHRHPGTEVCCTIRTNRGWLMGVNSNPSPRRQQYATAHAYGHVLLHDRPLTVCHSLRVEGVTELGPSAATDQEETEANIFASGLLLPEDLVRVELARELDAGHNSRDLLINTIAANCGVSREAIGHRLISLSLIGG